MTDIASALDNLRVHQRQLDMDGTEVGVSRQALNEAISYIGRLTADRDFWKDRLRVETRARIEAESLSRTGAVKVKALEWEDADEGMCTKWRAAALGGHYELVAFEKEPGFAVNFHWGRPLSFWFIQGEPDEWGPTGPKMFPTLEAAKAAAQADYERRILSALDPAAPEGQQEAAAWQHIPNCGVDRESKMVHVTGKVFCDPCIEPLVAALNAAGIETVASCCGHGHRPGVIVLRDGRELFIAKDFKEARKVDAAFPTDINGDARPAEQAVTEAMVEAAVQAVRPYTMRTLFIDEHRELVRTALKAAMEAGR